MSQPDPTPRQSWDLMTAQDIRRIVVVGGGPAAHRCVTGLRKLGFAGSVALVSAEQIPPYDRTLLSKDNLASDSAVAHMATAGEYSALDIDLVLGKKATALHPETCTVELGGGETLHYDRLVLAVGGAPVLPRTLAAPGVLTIRTSEDVGPVRDALERSRHVVVIGAGFVGGEVAAAATTAGCAVTVIEAQQTPLEGLLGVEVGGRVGRLHTSKGTDVRCGVQARSVVATPDGYTVALADGSSLHADSVVVGVGMCPNVDWLRSSTIEINRAIVTDAACRTSLPGVLAAGDCAEWWSPRYREYCHIEHWDTATKHGAAAARAALDQLHTFDPIPFFWSDQYDVKYQWAGYAPVWDSVDVEGDAHDDFAARYLLDGRLVGVFVANRPRQFGRLRRELGGTRESAGYGKEVVA